MEMLIRSCSQAVSLPAPTRRTIEPSHEPAGLAESRDYASRPKYHGAKALRIMKLYDFPNFGASNPWQWKTIDTAAPMPVVRSSIWRPPSDASLIHVGWEHYLFKPCRTAAEAESRAHQVVASLEQCRRRGVRILWTLHNLTAHAMPWKRAEQIVREWLAERAAVVFLMSEKHRLLFPSIPASKIWIVPHYIDRNPYLAQRETAPDRFGFFKFGAPRDDRDTELLDAILSSRRFACHVSDMRVAVERTDDDVILQRRFTIEEALRYAARSHFALFVRNPVLNSGVLNFYCGSRLAVFHTAESVKHLDLPPGLERFVMTDQTLHARHILETLASTPLPGDELADWLTERSADRVSHRWWQAALSA